MLMAENLLLMRRRYRTSVSAAALFLATYGPLGMVLDFADASVAIVSSGGALDYQSQGQVSGGALVGPGAKLTNSAPSVKLTEQADGLLKFQAHNLALWSENISNAAWNKSNVTVSGTVATATGAASNKFIRQLNLVSGGPSYSIQFDVVAGTHSLVQIYTDTPTTAYANFDLANGVLGTVGATATATIEAIGGGVYRCTANFASTGTNARLSFIDSTSAAWNATSSSTGTISVTRAHFRPTPSASDYIKTTSAAVYDLPYVYSGGVRTGIQAEPAATNLALRSTEFDNASWGKTGCSITANAVLAPDGTTTSDKIIESATLGDHFVSQSVVTASAAVFSVYLKAAERSKALLLVTGGATVSINADLSAGTVSAGAGSPTGSGIQALPGGWFRVFMAVSSTIATARVYVEDSSGAFNYTGDGTSGIYVWGAQVELGTVATSPIITYGSTVLRAADPPEIVTSLFPYNVSEGTLYIKAIAPKLVSNGRFLSLNNNSTAIRVADVFASIVTQIGVYKTIDATTMTTTLAAVGGNQRIAVRYKQNDYHSSYNGTLGTPDTATGAMETATMLEIGHQANANQMPMIIQQVAYFPEAKANAILQAMGA